MNQFSPITDMDIEYWMTGPLSNYVITISALFIDDYTLEVDLNTTGTFTGDESEYLHLRFNYASFISQNGTSLYYNEVKGNTYSTPINPALVAAAGTTVNAALTTSMVAIISSNIALGSSSTMLWGFINTVQIIFFMPLMSLYYPDHYCSFLTYLSSTKMNLDFIKITKFYPHSSEIVQGDKNMPALNQRYIDLKYNSTSVVANADQMFNTINTGIVTCIVIFCIRALIITLRPDGSPYQDMLDEIESKENNVIVLNDESTFRRQPTEEVSTRKKKIGKWARSKFS